MTRIIAFEIVIEIVKDSRITKPFNWAIPKLRDDNSGNPFCFFFKTKRLQRIAGKSSLKIISKPIYLHSIKIL